MKKRKKNPCGIQNSWQDDPSDKPAGKPFTMTPRDPIEQHGALYNDAKMHGAISSDELTKTKNGHKSSFHFEDEGTAGPFATKHGVAVKKVYRSDGGGGLAQRHMVCIHHPTTNADSGQIEDEEEDEENDDAAKKGTIDPRVSGGKRVPGDYTNLEPEELDEDEELEDHTVNEVTKPAIRDSNVTGMSANEDEEEEGGEETMNEEVENKKHHEEESEDDDIEEDDDMDGDDDDMDGGMEENCDSDMVRHSANSNKEREMKLKVVERDELVDNLITNSESWNHRGALAILSRMPDEQLIALNRDWLRQQELEAHVNNDRDFIGSDNSPNTEEVGEGGDAGDSDPTLPKNYKLVGKKNEPRGKPTGPVVDGGPDLESGRTGGGEMADEGDEDDPYDGDRQPIDNVEDWLNAVQAPDFVRNMMYNGLRADLELKANLIETITANDANPYSEDQLNMMTTNQLTPLAKLAAATQPVKGIGRQQSVANGRSRISNYIGSQGAPVNNRRQRNQEQSEDDMLIVPTLNWEEMAEENRKHA